MSRSRRPGIRATLERIKAGEASPFFCTHPSAARWMERLCAAGPSARLSLLAKQAAEFDALNARDVAGTSVLAQLIERTLGKNAFLLHAHGAQHVVLTTGRPPPYPLADYHAALDAAAATIVAAGHPDGLRLLARLAALR